jgi:hypothetical protein
MRVLIEGFGKVEGALRHRPRVGNPGAGPKNSTGQERDRGRTKNRANGSHEKQGTEKEEKKIKMTRCR